MQSRTNVATRDPESSILNELAPRFADVLDREVVAGCVRAAVADLRGSVGPEALPEMASRLAMHRLTLTALTAELD